MTVEVKKGGRQEYTCEKCGSTINVKEPHFRTGGKGGFKRYHKACLPVKGQVSKDTDPTGK